MISSRQTSYKQWQCDCVCPVFVSRPRLLMSLSAANLKSPLYNFPSLAVTMSWASVLLTRQRSKLQRPSQAAPDSVFECHHCQLKAPYCSFLSSYWSGDFRSASYWLPLLSRLPVMSIMPEIATNQATERL